MLRNPFQPCFVDPCGWLAPGTNWACACKQPVARFLRGGGSLEPVSAPRQATIHASEPDLGQDLYLTGLERRVDGSFVLAQWLGLHGSHGILDAERLRTLQACRVPCMACWSVVPTCQATPERLGRRLIEHSKGTFDIAPAPLSVLTAPASLLASHCPLFSQLPSPWNQFLVYKVNAADPTLTHRVRLRVRSSYRAGSEGSGILQPGASLPSTQRAKAPKLIDFSNAPEPAYVKMVPENRVS